MQICQYLCNFSVINALLKCNNFFAVSFWKLYVGGSRSTIRIAPFLFTGEVDSPARGCKPESEGRWTWALIETQIKHDAKCNIFTPIDYELLEITFLNFNFSIFCPYFKL